MKKFYNIPAHENEEAPNEFIIKRRSVLLGLLGTTLTPVSGLLAPAYAQDAIKGATQIEDFLANLPDMCRITTATVEGPYFIDQRIVRSNIRENQPGVPLELELRVVNANASCRPVKGAVVSLWHCNAEGEYSGYLFNDPNEFPDLKNVNEVGHVQLQDGERLLRGA